MDPQARLHLMVLIVAFGLVFVWGALLPLYFGIVSFSAQTVDVGLSQTGAAALSSGGTGFIMVFFIAGFLSILFIALVFQLAKQTPLQKT